MMSIYKWLISCFLLQLTFSAKQIFQFVKDDLQQQLHPQKQQNSNFLFHFGDSQTPQPFNPPQFRQISMERQSIFNNNPPQYQNHNKRQSIFENQQNNEQQKQFLQDPYPQFEERFFQQQPSQSNLNHLTQNFFKDNLKNNPINNLNNPLIKNPQNHFLLNDKCEGNQHIKMHEGYVTKVETKSLFSKSMEKSQYFEFENNQIHFLDNQSEKNSLGVFTLDETCQLSVTSEGITLENRYNTLNLRLYKPYEEYYLFCTLRTSIGQDCQIECDIYNEIFPSQQTRSGYPKFREVEKKDLDPNDEPEKDEKSEPKKEENDEKSETKKEENDEKSEPKIEENDEKSKPTNEKIPTKKIEKKQTQPTQMKQKKPEKEIEIKEVPIYLNLIPSPDCNMHWNYENQGQDWNCRCSEGFDQSPIDLQPQKMTKTQSMANFEFPHFKMKNINFIYDENMLKMTLDSNFVHFAKMTLLDGREYFSREIRIHTPAEHTILGKYYCLEVQVLYQDEVKEFSAFLSFMFEQESGAKNEFLDLFDPVFLPTEISPYLQPFLNKMDDVTISLSCIFKKDENIQMQDFGYYHYEGSHTSPPCSGNTHWFIYDQVLPYGESKILMIQNAAEGVNNRQVQPYKGMVSHYELEPVLKETQDEGGHYEMVKVKEDNYVYVGDNKPSNIQGAKVISKKDYIQGVTGVRRNQPEIPGRI